MTRLTHFSNCYNGNGQNDKMLQLQDVISDWPITSGTLTPLGYVVLYHTPKHLIVNIEYISLEEELKWQW